jgi:hypothetical protein
MSKEDFANNFEKLTQAQFYVGMFRLKDLSTQFNYQFYSQYPNLVGISNIVNYIEIENSVDLSFRVGRIGIRDNIDARKILPLMGNEIFYIEYNNQIEAGATVALTKSGFFRIMSMEDNTTSQQNNQSMRFVDRQLTFTIAEFPYVDILTFNSYKKSYSWNGGTLLTPPIGAKPISEIVRDIFIDPLDKFNTLKMGLDLTIMPTSDIQPTEWMNYYSPNWSKLKNINFLTRFATSLKDGYTGYYLNCEGPSIKYMSVYEDYLSLLRENNSIDLVPVDQMNLFPFDISPTNAANVLMDVRYKLGNVAGALFNGYSGETFFTFDYLSGHTFSGHDYRTFRQTSSSNESFYVNYQRFGNQNSSMAYSPFSPALNKKMKDYEYAQKSFNSMMCEATTFITNSRFVGQAVNIFVSPSTPFLKNINDPLFGDGWCVWGYKDIISNQRGICKLLLKKDSTKVPSILGTTMLNI